MAALTFQLQALTTSTGAVAGTSYAIDNTVFTTAVPDWTIWVEVQAMDAADFARFSVQDSVDGFTTIIAGPTFEVAGLTKNSYGRRYTFTKKDWPGIRFGVASAVLRVSLTLLQGTSPHVTWQAYYQGPLSN